MSERIPQPADDLETLDEQAALDAAKARQHIESLFRLLRGSDDAEPAAAAPGESHSVSQRFRVLRQHARGGLGEIWIAHDMELGREVALKEIRPRFAGRSDSWSRFQREATITGQLEHPGIVPIYALGHHENGQPFYAMRFVQGDTLADAIARFHRRDDAAPPPTERNLQLRKLITRLIDVCDAVAYAHSRNIIHRDLKPANIMLGEFGETLVVDWGLAKSLNEVTDETASATDKITAAESGSRSTPTQMGSAVGSPPYMSPEQAGGRLDQLGPASDIYSLGATLFELLTGQAPIGAAAAGESRQKLSIKELLQHIQEGRFPRPTTVNPAVPRALEAVCLKTMALRPEDRYRSARDLSADLESWLADEPVSAWTEPSQVRLRRWMRRHQTAVVSTMATVFVAVLGLSISLAIISDRNERLADGKTKLESSNRQLAKTNQELTESGKRESDARKLAERNANEAEANAREAQKQKAEAITARDLAETNARITREQTQLALDTLGAVIVDVQNGLADIPGSAQVRSQILQTALSRLDRVSEQFAIMGAVDVYKLHAIFELADVTLKLAGEYNPKTFGASMASVKSEAINKSPARIALKLFERGLEMAEKLYAQQLSYDPNRFLAQIATATAHHGLGQAKSALNDLDGATASYRKSLEILQQLVISASADEFARIPTEKSMVRCLNSLASIALLRGQVEDARNYAQQGIAICREALASDPTDVAFEEPLSELLNKQGDVSLRAGRVDEALDSFQQSLEIAEKLEVKSPTQANQHVIARGYQDLGRVCDGMGRTDDAIRFYKQGLDKTLQFAANDPTNLAFHRDLFSFYDALGQITFRKTNQIQDAIKFFDQAMESCRKQMIANPLNRQNQRDMAICLYRFGAVNQHLGQTKKAVDFYQQSLGIKQLLSVTEPSDIQAERELGIAHNTLVTPLLNVGEFSKAHDSARQAVEISRRVIAAIPNDDAIRVDLAVMLEALGNVEFRIQKTQDADGRIREALAIRREMAAKYPTNKHALLCLIVDFKMLGDCADVAFAFNEAAEWYRQIIDTHQRLERDGLFRGDKDIDFWRDAANRNIELFANCILAIEDWEHVVTQPTDKVPQLLSLRCSIMARKGRVPEVAQAAKKLQELEPNSKAALYDAACGFSLCVGLLTKAKTELSDEEKAERERYVRLARPGSQPQLRQFQMCRP